MSDANIDSRDLRAPGKDAGDPADIVGFLLTTPVELVGKDTPPEKPATRFETGSLSCGGVGQEVIVQCAGFQPSRRTISIQNIGTTVVIYGPSKELSPTVGQRITPGTTKTLAVTAPVYVTPLVTGEVGLIDWVALYNDGN